MMSIITGKTKQNVQFISLLNDLNCHFISEIMCIVLKIHCDALSITRKSLGSILSMCPYRPRYVLYTYNYPVSPALEILSMSCSSTFHVCWDLAVTSIHKKGQLMYFSPFTEFVMYHSMLNIFHYTEIVYRLDVEVLPC